MSENKDLKERFGNLGMYLVEEAQDEIKNLNQQILFQKAEIKKRYRERTEERSKKLQTRFIKDYNQKLNNQLTESILYSKEKVLKLKNRLIKQLINGLLQTLDERITPNYSAYADYILNSIKKNKKIFKHISNPTIIFNSRDYKYFTKNREKIKLVLDVPIKLIKSEEEFLGGYIIDSKEDKISYRFTLDEIKQENISFIESKFMDTISETAVKDLHEKFEEFIESQKENIEEYLIEYERI